MKSYADMLLEKTEKEYEQFKKQILEKEKQEIIRLAHEIVVKENILSILEEEYFTNTEMKKLLEIGNILDFFYNGWLTTEDSFMEELRNSIKYDLFNYNTSN